MAIMTKRRRPALRHIALSDLIGPKEVFKIALTMIGAEGLWDRQAHGHDYPEMFWIESGTGRHWVNGHEVPVQSGYLCTMRPSDCHTFVGQPDDPLAVMNLAFYVETLEHFRQRYFPNSSSYFWARGKVPYSCELDAPNFKWFMDSARQLASHTESLMTLDRFLMDALTRLDSLDRAGVDLPDWLQAALDRYTEPDHFQQGTAGFVELAGRGPEHVNRSLRRYLGLTTTEVVNRARMDWAANELRFTDRPILAICFDAGCGNVGHFYKLFKARHGKTPKAYRESCRAEARGLL